MTDNNHLLVDFWRTVGNNYLSLNDFKNLMSVNKAFNQFIPFQNANLQFAYARLCALDMSLPILLPADNVQATLFFRQAAEKILNRQKDEIKYLQGGQFRANNMPEDCMNQFYLETATIEQLENNSAILDEINCKIIRKEIDKDASMTILVLQSAGLTRFPQSIIEEPNYKAYFEALTSLDLSINYIKNLNVSTLNNLTKIDCSVNHVLEAIKVPNNIKKVICSTNKIKFLDLSLCSELEMVMCNENQIIAIDLPQNGKIFSLHCQRNKLKSLDLGGLVHLNNATLNFDYNPLEYLGLQGIDPFIQKQYNGYQTKLLFEFLSKNLHENDKKQMAIKELGSNRYTYANCLQYLGFQQTARIFSASLREFASSATYFLPSFMMSKKDEAMEIEKNLPPLKRERDEEEEPGNPSKKRKK